MCIITNCDSYAEENIRGLCVKITLGAGHSGVLPKKCCLVRSKD